mmetsp:Transcript_4392/g.7442  ORF Transcript_4392/g.7442 Transcript_4392/m.7442 type:complete len:86 (+) Transcript_4392:2039-2296(+)
MAMAVGTGVLLLLNVIFIQRLNWQEHVDSLNFSINGSQVDPAHLTQRRTNQVIRQSTQHNEAVNDEDKMEVNGDFEQNVPRVIVV